MPGISAEVSCYVLPKGLMTQLLYLRQSVSEKGPILRMLLHNGQMRGAVGWFEYHHTTFEPCLDCTTNLGAFSVPERYCGQQRYLKC